MKTTVLSGNRAETPVGATASSTSTSTARRDPPPCGLCGSAKNSDQVLGNRSPILPMVSRSWRLVAADNPGIDHPLAPSVQRTIVPRQQHCVSSPICGIPKREMKRRSEIRRLGDGRQQIVDRGFAPAPRAPEAGRAVPPKHVDRDFTSPSSKKARMCFTSPRPSMSKAIRDTKWRSRSTAWAGQMRAAGAAARLARLAHRVTTAFRALFRHGEGGLPPLPIWVDHRTICGMTSPARWTTTRSPIRTSRRAISSSLCRVARPTTTPPTVTGSSSATRRPPCARPESLMSFSTVSACSAANLWAIAQRAPAADKAEAVLQLQIVDLVNHAVDIVVEAGAMGRHVIVIGHGGVEVPTTRLRGLTAEPQASN